MGPKAERLRSLPLPLCTKDSKVHAHFVRTFAATVLGPPPGEGQGGEGPALPAEHGTANTTDVVH